MPTYKLCVGGDDGVMEVQCQQTIASGKLQVKVLQNHMRDPDIGESTRQGGETETQAYETETRIMGKMLMEYCG